DSARVLVVDYRRPVDPVGGRVFAAALGAAREVETAPVDDRTTPTEWRQLRARADSFDLVVAAVHATPAELRDTTVIPEFGPFVDSLTAAGTPTLAVSFGSPYVLEAFPSVPAYLIAWGGADVSQRAAAGGLLGEVPVTGHLPVSLPPHHEVGEGLRREAVATAHEGREPAPADGPPDAPGGPPDPHGGAP
ncbi:MAG: hypothetical protein GWM90_31250, partial [Gemmatimonadetes bacterium]|nr:hypothetical protein [Gemmatimonadota bacterium]NIQ59692.1 hypothetical protein [Gemmatimonadota bacterium]NIU79893.1 hypothetical protein [Gammaproteobacteria bacterium]NIX48376.1 hypothetical protein [Gemmatimonadota bacterium]NIY12816.1 hypothetical protein [Gemmatimonadota bacterium]